MDIIKNFFDFHKIYESSEKKASVCGIVCNDKGEVLILQRGAGYNDPKTNKYIKNPWMPLKWNFPGGQVDEGESFKQAFKREVFEETSLEINTEDIEKFKVIKDPYYTLHVFQVDKSTGNVVLDKNQIPPECVNFAWVNLNTFTKYEYVPYTKEMIGEFFKKKINI